MDEQPTTCPCKRLVESEAILEQYQQERIEYAASEEQMVKMIEDLKADNHRLLVDLHVARDMKERQRAREGMQ